MFSEAIRRINNSQGHTSFLEFFISLNYLLIWIGVYRNRWENQIVKIVASALS